MSKSKNRAVFGVLFLVFLFFIILMIFATYTMQVLQDESSGITASRSKGKIGIIEVQGVIMDSKDTVELLHRAEKDKSIEAIILRINSPGGAVGPSQEIYEEIRRIDMAYDARMKEGKDKKKKDSDIPERGKPIYASFGTMAASGGYYIGAAARRIYSNPGTLTGSIGVIMQFMDLSKLYELAKVKQETIKAGRYKDAGHPDRPMTTEERKMLTDLIAGVHKQFRDHISAPRAKKLKRDLKELAQGQIFSGEQALEYGLVDRMGSLWTAAREVHEELNLEGEMTMKYIKKKKKVSVWEFMDSLEEAANKLSFSTIFNKVPFLMAKMKY
ncbi:MAG: protease-4 [Bacteriovoracaceae bacterium]